MPIFPLIGLSQDTRGQWRAYLAVPESQRARMCGMGHQVSPLLHIFPLLALQDEESCVGGSGVGDGVSSYWGAMFPSLIASAVWRCELEL